MCCLSDHHIKLAEVFFALFAYAAYHQGAFFHGVVDEMVEQLEESSANEKGSVWDLVAPVIVLIAGCVLGLIYSGGFFDAGSDAYHQFISSFSGADASVG